MWDTRQWIGSLGTLSLLTSLVAVESGAAQQDWRLTLRPHEMATGTRTAQAGKLSLDSFPKFLLYVPPQCVGTRRCPLVISPDYYYRILDDWQTALADKYGMILFVDSANAQLAVPRVDSALKQILRQFAIDPDRIGLLATRGTVYQVGRPNADIFSRIASIDPGSTDPDILRVPSSSPSNMKVQYFMSGAVEDDFGLRTGSNIMAAVLRNEGASVVQSLSLKRHQHCREDYELAWRWLHESWASPGSAARPKLPSMADSMPVLTTEALAHMTTFWTLLMKEPDSIVGRDELTSKYNMAMGRKAYMKEVLLPVGQAQVLAWITDIPALAAAYPSVAADLKTAGLTAQQADAYRAALISARATWYANKEAPAMGRAEPTSVLGKNVAFVDAHPAEIKAADATNMWAIR